MILSGVLIKWVGLIDDCWSASHGSRAYTQVTINPRQPPFKAKSCVAVLYHRYCWVRKAYGSVTVMEDSIEARLI